ncbi:MAG: dihydrolipoyl dehydrogenase [Oscillospiraceae bacterium]|nr:dihydrolipoyl dehydrogenase [Oscillospiraceae bacterium]
MAYDVIVLGGGPGGYIAAERAGHAGLKTLLIEKRALGGTCLNEGCIPSKVLLNSSKIFHYTTDYGKLYGVVCDGSHVDQKTVIERKRKVIATLVGGVGMAMKANHVEVVNAIGTIVGRSGDVISVEAEGKTYEGKYLIIATGSKASVPPIPGVKEGIASGFVMTNYEALELETLPKRMVVIGGGVIGLELAAYYGVVGCKVDVVEMLPKIAGPIDGEISALLQKGYEKDGMTFHLGAKVVRVDGDGVVFEKNGKEEKLTCDKVLLAIGRKPVIDTCGIEKLNIVTERGAIRVDDQMRTNALNVFAVGDCNGRSMLAHSAYRMGEVAVNTILGRKDRMRYKAIPSVLYTNPEVASVGVSEEQAKAAGIDTVSVKLPMAYAGRYVAENEGGNGIAKFIFDKKYRTLIGAHVMSNYSSEFIVACAVMIEQEMTVDAIREIVYPHPSVSEIIREAAFAVQL